MSRQIRIFELKKVFASPIILALIGIFLVINAFLIIIRSDMSNELAVLTEMVEKYGHEIDEEAIYNWEQEHTALLGEINETAEQKISQTFTSASEFFDDFSNQQYFSDEEVEQFAKIAVLGSYLARAKDADNIYIDLETTAEAVITQYKFRGELADTILEKYKEAQVRIDEIRASGEYKHFFFDGSSYEMHSFLFSNILQAAGLEIMILSVLLTAFLLSYEFDLRTYLVAYTTKCGRKLQLEKLKAVLLAAPMLTSGLLAVTLAMYFFVYDYSELWNVPISSIFMSENDLFLAFFWDMSFSQYLLAVIGIIYACQMLFILLAFGLSQLSRNGYLAVIFFVILSGIAILTPSFLPRNSNLVLYTGFTPFAIILHPEYSFMIGGVSNIYKHYELMTVGVWSFLMTILVIFCYHRFKVHDL